MAPRFSRSLTTVACVAVALLASACSDTVTDPSPNALRPDGPHMTIASTSITTAVLYPTYDNVYVSVEGHRIVIPANSVCNPLTSGYGPAFWNAPCQTATAPILFTITTTVNEEGYSRVTVSPDVRFSPTKQVMAYFKDSVASRTPGLVIKYCTLLKCVDEGLTDASLKTYRDPTAGIIYRRLKHFSGYNVVFGFNCTEGEPCDDGNGGMASKAAALPLSYFQGYITTTGLTTDEASR